MRGEFREAYASIPERVHFYSNLVFGTIVCFYLDISPQFLKDLYTVEVHRGEMGGQKTDRAVLVGELQQISTSTISSSTALHIENCCPATFLRSISSPELAPLK